MTEKARDFTIDLLLIFLLAGIISMNYILPVIGDMDVLNNLIGVLITIVVYRLTGRGGK